MSRVAFDDKNGVWVDLFGIRSDIKLEKVKKDDYFYHVEGSDLILRCFASECSSDKPLGEIYTLDGVFVENIPPFFNHLFLGDSNNYKSNIYWVKDCNLSTVTFVVRCSLVDDFTVKLNLKDLVYSDLKSIVR